MGLKLETCDIHHSIPLDELNTNMQEFLAGGENPPSYRPLKSKTIGGSKLIFGVKNSNIHMTAHLKELVKLSRMRPKSARLASLSKVILI